MTARIGDQRGMMLTLGAYPDVTAAKLPRLAMTAFRTYKAVGPLLPNQILPTLFIGTESCHKCR